MLNLLLADAASGAAAAPIGGSSMNMLITLALMFAIFYFMLIRPQNRKEKERRKMIDELSVGKRIIFAGGLIGKICEVRDTTFLVEIAPQVKIEIAKDSVSEVLSEETTQAK